MTIGVILMTYGAPTGDEDIAAYLGRVRGREPTPELAVEMRRRYRLIGGSPLVDITRAQAEALAEVLGTDFRVRGGASRSPRSSRRSTRSSPRARSASSASRCRRSGRTD